MCEIDNRFTDFNPQKMLNNLTYSCNSYLASLSS